MKLPSSRELLAKGLIVVAICVGGWMILVSPKIQQAARIEAELAQAAALTAKSPLNEMNATSVEDVAVRISEIKSRLALIQSFNSMADDSSRLYGLVMDLADQHRVQVQSLQPGTLRQTSEDKRSTFTRLNVTVEGTYQDIAAFLESVCDLDAFLRPVMVGLTPARNSTRGERVEAVFNCDVVKFAIADPLQGLEATAHGQP